MPSISYDLKYLKAGIDELESYLLSKKLFWPIGAAAPEGDPHFPRLTLGGILLSRARLHARDLPKSDAFEFHSLQKELDHWRSKWITAWERKAVREFNSRIRQWRHYLDELNQNPDRFVPYYDSQVRLRVLIEILLGEIRKHKNESIENLQNLDGFLRSVFVPGEFLWEPDLESGFDREKFWYLWGEPEIENNWY
jgi:hypothetical protein